MKSFLKTLLFAVVAFAASTAVLCASDGCLKGVEHGGTDGKLNINKIINEHTTDNYWWHIATYNGRHISIHLPVIVRSKETGWHVFSSARLAEGRRYEGFSIAAQGKYVDKIVAFDADEAEYRPVDISITKNVLALMINSIIMVTLFLCVARWYGRRSERTVPRGFVGAVEMFVMSIEDEVIRKNIGADSARYSPYLLTAFFFIFINNIMGLLPVFPGGANTTGNIAVTLVLSLATMIAINLFGNRHYWKDILWPDVPWWMKAPLPLMQIIELFGVITKPFALMVRLMANILAGHTILVALMFMIFVTAKMGIGVNAGMTLFSIIMSIFMNLLELLVAYIQAYVFTMLSAVFIGLSRPSNHKKEKTENIIVKSN